MMRLNELPNQHKDEKVELFLRRHWVTNTRLIVLSFFFFGAPLVAGFAFYADKIETWYHDPYLGPLVSTIAIIYFFSVWLFAFMEFTDFYLDTWIVTNERVINIEQKGLFSRVASELPLDAVQDVTSNVQGVIRTMLDFGDVVVQTAGQKKQFHFKEIAHPEKVKEQIIRIVEDNRERKRQQIASVEQAKTPV